MIFKYNERQKMILKGVEGQLASLDVTKEISAKRKEISNGCKIRHPLVKEYVKLYAEQEKDPRTYIGRMTKEMKEAVLMREALKKAAEFCEDPEDKQDFLDKSNQYANSPAIINYDLYLDGLRYMAGMSKELDPNTKKFFEQELRAPITEDEVYHEYRTRTAKEIGKTQSSNLKTFQEKIAPKMAEHLYAAPMTGIETVENQYLPNYPLNMRAHSSLIRDRLSPTAFLIGRMIKEGYTMEQATDPRQLRDVKERLGDEYIQHREAGDVAWYFNEMYEGAQAMLKEFDNYCIRHKDELKTDRDIVLHSNEIVTLSQYCYDLFQELSELCLSKKNDPKMDEAFRDQLKYSYEEYDKMGAEVSSCQNLALGFVSRPVNYKTGTESELMISTLLMGQLERKQVLDELQKENPDMANVRANQDDFGHLQVQLLDAMKHTKALDGVKTMGSLNEKALNKVIDLYDGSFLAKNNIGYQKSRTKPEITEEGMLQAHSLTSDVRYILYADNVQMGKTKIPANMEKYLSSLDKGASLRGKNSDNSSEFNTLLNNFDEVRKTLEGKNLSDKEYLGEMNKIKEAAEKYILAKREQKGYLKTSVADKSFDDKMLGKEKGADSIFTSRGKERYEFAMNIVENIAALQNALNAPEMEAAKENADLNRQDDEMENEGNEM